MKPSTQYSETLDMLKREEFSRKLLDKIKEYDTIIIHRHKYPDPDAIGSQAGLGHLITELYPNKNVLLAGELHGSLTQFATMDNVNEKDYENALVIIVDTANKERIDGDYWDKGDYIIKIDHHPSTPGEDYGDLEYVDTTYSSVGELLTIMFEEQVKYVQRCSNPSHSSKLLFLGVSGDTGHFNYTNTTSRTFHAASVLLEDTFTPETITSKLRSKSFKEMKLMGKVLDDMTMDDTGVIPMIISQEWLKELDLTVSETDIVTNLPKNIDGAKIWTRCVELGDGSFKVSIRSNGITINDIAAKYNGGGHDVAAGAKVKDKQELESMITDLKNRAVRQ